MGNAGIGDYIVTQSMADYNDIVSYLRQQNVHHLALQLNLDKAGPSLYAQHTSSLQRDIGDPDRGQKDHFPIAQASLTPLNLDMRKVKFIIQR